MAIDTDTRKFSAINPLSPWRGICAIPQATIDEPSRFSLLFLYNEFAAGTSDTTPDAFSFTDQAGVATSSTITSAPVTITGIDATVPFTADGGTIDVNGDNNFQTSRDVVNNDQIRAQHTSSASYLTATNTVVTGGGVSGTFTSVTEIDPSATAVGDGQIHYGFGFGF